MKAHYHIERFENGRWSEDGSRRVYGDFKDSRYVGGDYEEAVRILESDRRSNPGVDFRLRTTY